METRSFLTGKVQLSGPCPWYRPLRESQILSLQEPIASEHIVPLMKLAVLFSLTLLPLLFSPQLFFSPSSYSSSHFKSDPCPLARLYRASGVRAVLAAPCDSVRGQSRETVQTDVHGTLDPFWALRGLRVSVLCTFWTRPWPSSSRENRETFVLAWGVGRKR